MIAEVEQLPELDTTLHSDSDEFGTPPHLFKALNEEFHFTLDAAASHENALLPNYMTAEDDALKQNWATFQRLDCHEWIPVPNTVFCNPPYSRGFVPAFVKKAYEESLMGVTSVLLLPARTEQPWFHDIVLPYAEVRFVRGRLKFVGGKTSARWPSMVVIFPKNYRRRIFGKALTALEPRCTP